MFSGITVRAFDIVCVSSHSFGVKTIHPLFCGIPYYVSSERKKSEKRITKNVKEKKKKKGKEERRKKEKEREIL